MSDLYELERAWRAEGASAVCGVDEAGRGPLAGPVCAAAVILPPGLEIPGLRPAAVLVDGNREPALDVPVRCIVGGDGRCACIAAASILAKVTRDRLMEELDRRYPQYGFAVHKGYGTRRHYEALERYGPSPVHRKTFLKKFYARKESAGPLG